MNVRLYWCVMTPRAPWLVATNANMDGNPDYVFVKEVDVDFGEIREIDMQKVVADRRVAEADKLRKRLAELEKGDV